MDPSLDELFASDIAMPFPNTAQFDGHRSLVSGLEKTDAFRPLMDPLLPETPRQWEPGPWPSDDISSEDEEVFPQDLTYFSGVGPDFGPGGGNARWRYKVHREPATDEPIPEMHIVSQRGQPLFRIRPKFGHRLRITRGCVEGTIAEWMQKQRELPISDTNKHDVRWGFNRYRVDGEEKRVGVWFWRGLEQDPWNPEVFKIFLT